MREAAAGSRHGAGQRDCRRHLSVCRPPTGDVPIDFNQFLIDDERPTLIHTGYHEAYDAVRAAVAKVIDPKRLAYVVLGHFEADECGGMDRFLDEAPGSVLVASELGAGVNLAHWGYRGTIRGMRDGEVLEIGRRRLRFLETPHVHHWDSMMVFDEATSSLFPADLFIQPGDQPPVVEEDLTQAMLQLYRASGIFAHEAPVRRVVDRVERLDPAWIHPMHGGWFLGPHFPIKWQSADGRTLWATINCHDNKARRSCGKYHDRFNLMRATLEAAGTRVAQR